MGLFNHYREGMPLTEQWLKDFRHAFYLLKNRMTNGGKAATILAFPEYPSKKTTLSKIAKNLGYNLSNKAKLAKLQIYWEDTTHGVLPERLKSAKHKVLNAKLVDISKQHVDAIHQEVFGYSTIIDPLTFEGNAVSKSDINAKHDGQIIDCPIAEKKKDQVYQILIDNQCNVKEVVDIRLPIMGKPLDFCYLKFRSLDVRFTNLTHRVELQKTQDLLSEKEVSLIARFCDQIHLDFGELDVLRHKGNGKIYIVDVNKTPYGPPDKISQTDFKFAVAELSMAFESTFLKP